MRKFQKFNDIWARAKWMQSYGNWHERPDMLGVNPTLRLQTMNQALKFEDDSEAEAFDFLRLAVRSFFNTLRGNEVEGDYAWIPRKDFDEAYREMSQAYHRLEGYRKR